MTWIFWLTTKKNRGQTSNNLRFLSEKESRKLSLEAERDEKRGLKEAAEAPEKEALDFYRQLEEEENRRKVVMVRIEMQKKSS